MAKDIEKRVIDEANIIVSEKITLRELSKRIGVSKSTIHKDMQVRLSKLDYDLYLKVQKVFYEHILTRHYLGGLSTRKKYQKSNIK